MITWGKGMGGGMPVAGLTIRKDLAQKIDDRSQSNTFAGNAVTSAACMTNIDILTENDHALIERAAILGAEIKNQIREGAKDTRVICDVWGRGFMIGIEMVEDKETREPLNLGGVGQIIMGMLKRFMGLHAIALLHATIDIDKRACRKSGRYTARNRPGTLVCRTRAGNVQNEKEIFFGYHQD